MGHFTSPFVCRDTSLETSIGDSTNEETEKFHNIDAHCVSHTKPSLVRTLARVFMPKFLQATLLKLMQDILIFVVPELLRRVVD